MSSSSACRNEWPIHHKLLLAFSNSNREMIRRTRAFGLMPGQPKVLEYLVHHEGAAQYEIARGCGMDRSTLTSVLTRMESAGLIERSASCADRRSIVVVLTPAGREAAAQVCRLGGEVDELCLAGLDTEERAELARLLDRVIQNLEQVDEGCK